MAHNGVAIGAVAQTGFDSILAIHARGEGRVLALIWIIAAIDDCRVAFAGNENTLSFVLSAGDGGIYTS
jgi:hypothetical protein